MTRHAKQRPVRARKSNAAPLAVVIAPCQRRNSTDNMNFRATFEWPAPGKRAQSPGPSRSSESLSSACRERREMAVKADRQSLCLSAGFLALTPRSGSCSSGYGSCFSLAASSASVASVESASEKRVWRHSYAGNGSPTSTDERRRVVSDLYAISEEDQTADLALLS